MWSLIQLKVPCCWHPLVSVHVLYLYWWWVPVHVTIDVWITVPYFVQVVKLNSKEWDLRELIYKKVQQLLFLLKASHSLVPCIKWYTHVTLHTTYVLCNVVHIHAHVHGAHMYVICMHGHKHTFGHLVVAHTVLVLWTNMKKVINWCYLGIQLTSWGYGMLLFIEYERWKNLSTKTSNLQELYHVSQIKIWVLKVSP